MATNLELVERIIKSGCKTILEDAARNMAERLDIIANMKSESPVGQLQLVTGAQFFDPQPCLHCGHVRSICTCPVFINA